jgi:hypothetical protein
MPTLQTLTGLAASKWACPNLNDFLAALPSDIPSDSTTCDICNEEFGTATQDCAAEDTLQLPCGHIFGSLCLRDWLSQASTCPICRRQYIFTAPLPPPLPESPYVCGLRKIEALSFERLADATFEDEQEEIVLPFDVCEMVNRLEGYVIESLVVAEVEGAESLTAAALKTVSDRLEKLANTVLKPAELYDGLVGAAGLDERPGLEVIKRAVKAMVEYERLINELDSLAAEG